jgi:hypothetical protein
MLPILSNNDNSAEMLNVMIDIDPSSLPGNINGLHDPDQGQVLLVGDALDLLEKVPLSLHRLVMILPVGDIIDEIYTLFDQDVLNPKELFLIVDDFSFPNGSQRRRNLLRLCRDKFGIRPQSSSDYNFPNKTTTWRFFEKIGRGIDIIENVFNK